MGLFIVDQDTNEVTGEITEIPEITAISESLHKEYHMGMDLSASASFTASIDVRTMLSLLTGKHITNNYLKYHGGVLQRKRYRR